MDWVHAASYVYARAERNGFETRILDLLDGEEANKSVTVEVSGNTPTVF